MARRSREVWRWLGDFPGYGRLEQNQHVYLPSVFFCVGLALMICSLSRRRLAWVAAVGLVVFYAGVQQVNNGPWLRASDLVHAAQRDPTFPTDRARITTMSWLRETPSSLVRFARSRRKLLGIRRLTLPE